MFSALMPPESFSTKLGTMCQDEEKSKAHIIPNLDEAQI